MEELVQFEQMGDRVGVARMVREKPLNSLLLETIDLLSAQIFPWLADENTACIVLDSSSDRAFCAGADIAAHYHAIKAAGGDNAYSRDFFLNEYRLDYALHTTPKPVVAWGHGIVMGGGLGLLGGCSHRIGTVATRIAMPEITIGLFPDAGGTWFLSQIGRLGLFAGLTGCQLSAGDARALNLLDHIVDPAMKPEILEDLASLSWTAEPNENRQLVSGLLEKYETGEDLSLNLVRHKEVISALMQSCIDSEDFLATFEQGLDKLPDDEWLNEAVATYRRGSPTTACVFVEQMRRAKGMTLADMFKMELVIACQCARHPDFPEGVRALLIDKDRRPVWTYTSAADVPQAYVEEHFKPSWEGQHPLDDLE